MSRAPKAPALHVLPRQAVPLLCLFALLLILEAPACATTLVALDDDDLIDRSALIVTGSCTGVSAEWREGVLVTVAVVGVETVLKGEHTGPVELLVPGGVDLDREVPITVTYAGAPSIAPGERMLLFLTPAGLGTGHYTITGFSQGKYSIVETSAGEPVVRRDLAGVTLVTGTSAQRGGHRAVPLAVLEERIARRTGRGPSGDAR